MVPLSDRDVKIQQALADPELRGYCEFILRRDLSVDSQGTNQRKLLESIVNSQGDTCAAFFEDFTNRKVNAQTDWIHNDCLIFLLLLGGHKFGLPLADIDAILTARECNPNPVAVKSTQVFRAIQRSEFSLEGEYSFVKVVFLDLLDRLHLSRKDGLPVYQSLTEPTLLDELPPFLCVVAIRAFDLLITCNAPTEDNTLQEVIETIHRLSPNWTLSETLRFAYAMPIKRFVVFWGVLAALASTLAGAGYWLMAEGSAGDKPPEQIQLRAPPHSESVSGTGGTKDRHSRHQP